MKKSIKSFKFFLFCILFCNVIEKKRVDFKFQLAHVNTRKISNTYYISKIQLFSFKLISIFKHN